jgi:hypothetical protein
VVAKKYEVSSNFLARVCERLNVSRPSRGYWAQVNTRSHRRRVGSRNVTAHPYAAWAAQQMIEAVAPDVIAECVIRDRDRIFGAVFDRRLLGERRRLRLVRDYVRLR